MKKTLIIITLIIITLSIFYLWVCKADQEEFNSSDKKISEITNQIEQLTSTDTEFRNTFNENATEIIRLNKEIIRLQSILNERKTLEQEVNLALQIFKELPEYNEYNCFIKTYNKEENIITIDIFELISMNDKERIEELNLSLDVDFPSGFYLHNETTETVDVKLNIGTELYIISYENIMHLKKVNQNIFIESMTKYGFPCRIIVIGDKVLQVTERYLP